MFPSLAKYSAETPWTFRRKYHLRKIEREEFLSFHFVLVYFIAYTIPRLPAAELFFYIIHRVITVAHLVRSHVYRVQVRAECPLSKKEGTTEKYYLTARIPIWHATVNSIPEFWAQRGRSALNSSRCDKVCPRWLGFPVKYCLRLSPQLERNYMNYRK